MLATLGLMLSLLMISGCEVKPSDTQSVNSSQFTSATELKLSGCGNLYEVSKTLYRGEQPTAKGFEELEKIGIKTVVNLRNLHSDRNKIEGTSLGYEYIGMEAWNPKLDQVESFLKIATDPEKQPVFVHCHHGSDRTGMMVAVYRIVIEGWQVEPAIDEMRNGPFGFHEIFSGLPKFIEKLDIESLRSQFNEDRSDL